MKKLLTFLLAMLLCTAAYAEGADLPARILPQEESAITLADALTKAKAAIDKLPEQAMLRANLVQTVSGAKRWMVTIFDTATLMDAWCVTLDGDSGAFLDLEKSEEGFYFAKAVEAWTAVKGRHVLWSLEDKQLFEDIYAETPYYRLPQSTDLSAEQALQRALTALGMQDADGYEVGYYYFRSSEDHNGTWEVNLVENTSIRYRVSMDATTGEIIVITTPDPDEEENG